MSNLKRNGRILALLVIMGILFGTQGMTALAGTMGVGAAAGPAGGPGMEAVGPSDQNDEQEKPSETDGVQSAEGQPAGGSEAQGGTRTVRCRIRNSGYSGSFNSLI